MVSPYSDLLSRASMYQYILALTPMVDYGSTLHLGPVLSTLDFVCFGMGIPIPPFMSMFCAHISLVLVTLSDDPILLIMKKIGR